MTARERNSVLLTVLLVTCGGPTQVDYCNQLDALHADCTGSPLHSRPWCAYGDTCDDCILDCTDYFARAVQTFECDESTDPAHCLLHLRHLPIVPRALPGPAALPIP